MNHRRFLIRHARNNGHTLESMQRLMRLAQEHAKNLEAESMACEGTVKIGNRTVPVATATQRSNERIKR